jgi:hypothetical protein
MSLKLNSSGGGSVTLQEPVTASTLTLNLPAFSGTAATLATVTNNGVLYVNSSGQPTSGSGMIFDGANFGVGTAALTNFGGNFVVSQTSGASGGYSLQVSGSVVSQVAADATASVGYTGTRSNHPHVFTTNNAERARIDTSGNLLVGATSGSSKLVVGGSSGLVTTPTAIQMDNTYGTASFDKLKFYLFKGASESYGFGLGSLAEVQYWAGSSSTGAHVWYTSQTERARIDTAGQFTTAFSGSSGSVGIRSGTAAAAATNFFFFMATAAGVDRFQVRGDGNVLNTNNSYGAISDAKLKENVTDATPKLDKLNQVRVVNFNMIGDEQKQIGVIAQELEQIFPGMVDESPDRDKDGNDLGTTTKSVKYSVFVPMLIKAIQEQQALIQTLTVRVAALESN